MHKIGILWSEPERWQIGKNCHLENIICPTCGGIETAWVLHGHLNGKPEFHRMHLCDQCGKYIGPHRWRLAADQPANVPGEAATLPGIEAKTGASEKSPAPMAAPPGATGAPGAGCFVCQELRAGGQWPENCESCKPATTEAPAMATGAGIEVGATGQTALVFG